QIGSTALPCTSLRTTMGMLVTGSIINPRIFISSSIAPSCAGCITAEASRQYAFWGGIDRDPNGGAYPKQPKMVGVRQASYSGYNHCPGPGRTGRAGPAARN